MHLKFIKEYTTKPSQSFLELVYSQAGVSNDCGHRVRIHGIVTRHDDMEFVFGHKYVFALAVNPKTSFCGAKMINAG
jgi:hypothetical protein